MLDHKAEPAAASELPEGPGTVQEDMAEWDAGGGSRQDSV